MLPVRTPLRASRRAIHGQFQHGLSPTPASRSTSDAARKPRGREGTCGGSVSSSTSVNRQASEDYTGADRDAQEVLLAFLSARGGVGLVLVHRLGAERVCDQRRVGRL